MTDENVDEVRAMIGTALDDEPPVGIGYDSVHAAGRRRLARRHAGFLGGAVLGVVAVATAAVTVGQLVAGPSNAPGGGPPATSTSATAPAPAGCTVPAMTGGFSSAPDGSASPAELAESGRLTQAFARFALPLPAGVTAEPAEVKLCAIKESWGAELTLRSPGGDRAIFIEVRPRAGQAPGECATFGGRVTCTPRTLQDGTAIRLSETPSVDPTQPTIIQVEAWRPDDTVVRVMETGSEGTPAGLRILDDDALIAIATAPELKVNWAPAPSTQPAEPSDRRAGELSDVLAKANVLPSGMHAQAVDGHVAAMSFFVSQGGYKLSADLADRQGVGHLFINLSPPVDGGPQEPDCRGETTCGPIVLPDGRKATLTHRPNADIGGVTMLILNSVGADGSQLTIMSSNVSEASTGKTKNSPSAGPTRPEPSLGANDLARIAALPGLRW
jgi:hypothetical protein